MFDGCREVVRLGEWDLTTEKDCTKVLSGTELVDFCAPPAQNFTVEETVTHPLYNTRADHSDDIALLRLNRTIDFSMRKSFTHLFTHSLAFPSFTFLQNLLLLSSVAVLSFIITFSLVLQCLLGL